MRFVVEVGAGAVAAGSGHPDDLANNYWLSYVDEGLLEHVAVAGDGEVGVEDVDVPAFSALDLGGAAEEERMEVPSAR